jgi:hypothetical protein
LTDKYVDPETSANRVNRVYEVNSHSTDDIDKSPKDEIQHLSKSKSCIEGLNNGFFPATDVRVENGGREVVPPSHRFSTANIPPANYGKNNPPGFDESHTLKSRNLSGNRIDVTSSKNSHYVPVKDEISNRLQEQIKNSNNSKNSRPLPASVTHSCNEIISEDHVNLSTSKTRTIIIKADDDSSGYYFPSLHSQSMSLSCFNVRDLKQMSDNGEVKLMSQSYSGIVDEPEENQQQNWKRISVSKWIEAWEKYNLSSVAKVEPHKTSVPTDSSLKMNPDMTKATSLLNVPLDILKSDKDTGSESLTLDGLKVPEILSVSNSESCIVKEDTPPVPITTTLVDQLQATIDSIISDGEDEAAKTFPGTVGALNLEMWNGREMMKRQVTF